MFRLIVLTSLVACCGDSTNDSPPTGEVQTSAAKPSVVLSDLLSQQCFEADAQGCQRSDTLYSVGSKASLMQVYSLSDGMRRNRNFHLALIELATNRETIVPLVSAEDYGNKTMTPLKRQLKAQNALEQWLGNASTIRGVSKQAAMISWLDIEAGKIKLTSHDGASWSGSIPRRKYLVCLTSNVPQRAHPGFNPGMTQAWYVPDTKTFWLKAPAPYGDTCRDVGSPLVALIAK